jgi:ribonuclease R
LVHISELGDDYYQYNESLNELRGERTGIRHQLGDALQVQVSRVDLEGRRIDFRPVRKEDYKSLQAEIEGGAHPAPRGYKKAAGTKPAALKGTTARQRRAEAKRAARQTPAHKRHS